MLTGLDPHGHAVPRNGFPLERGVPTLAERLKARGFETRAVIAAAALESAMGLSRGFDSYDDGLDDQFGRMVQDRGERVVARVSSSLDARDPSKPLFLFTHFYDAHSPYDAPGDARERFVDPDYQGPLRQEPKVIRTVKTALKEGTADPEDVDYVASLYLGEVAYMDAQIGRLFDDLDRRGILEHALVIITADHGEILGEIPAFAYSHGYDVWHGSSRVPLIVVGHGLSLPRGRVVRRQVGLSGLAPTVERLLGLEATLGDRRDFAELLRPGPVNDVDGWPHHPTWTVFSEATRGGEDAEGWNNLGRMRGVRAGSWEAIGWPHKYLPLSIESQDGGARSDLGLLPTLADMMQAWDEAAPPYRAPSMSQYTREALEALGYLGRSEPQD